MEFIKQTIKGKNGNCLSACIASLFGMDINDIPIFHEDKIWCSDLSEWFNKTFNKFCVPIKLDLDGDEYLFQESIIITCVNSDHPEVERHAVLSRGIYIIFDPNIGQTNKLITKDLDPIFLIVSDIYQ